MKVKCKVISPLGTFESDVKEVDLTEDQVSAVYEQCYKMNYLALHKGTDTIYLPADVIQKSVIIVSVTR